MMNIINEIVVFTLFMIIILPISLLIERICLANSIVKDISSDYFSIAKCSKFWQLFTLKRLVKFAQKNKNYKPLTTALTYIKDPAVLNSFIKKTKDAYSRNLAKLFINETLSYLLDVIDDSKKDTYLRFIAIKRIPALSQDCELDVKISGLDLVLEELAMLTKTISIEDPFYKDICDYFKEIDIIKSIKVKEKLSIDERVEETNEIHMMDLYDALDATVDFIKRMSKPKRKSPTDLYQKCELFLLIFHPKVPFEYYQDIIKIAIKKSKKINFFKYYKHLLFLILFLITAFTIAHNYGLL